MTAQSSIPLKWYVPFAQNDASRVELPVTTSDATRASQSLGFPPLTMQPPESGGVPPQGEDFNGGMNQIARVAWWILNGGGFPFDAVFAANSNINGYPNGAVVQAADFRGDWISTADNNQNNPDTGSGSAWVPGFQYGSTTLASQTGGTVTLTPAQASKKGITISGTLTSALTVIMPTWIKDWSITNNTMGAFVTVVKTLAGSGVTIPQNGSPTAVNGDGTNINQPGQNIATGTSPTHAMTVAQGAGVVGSARNVFMSVTAASATASLTADEVIVETALGGTRYCLPSFSQSINLAAAGAGGMDTGVAPVSGAVALYAIYNPTSGVRALLATNATSAVVPNIYGGANMPSGYTASALLAVWPTNSSSQFPIGFQRDRRRTAPAVSIFHSTTTQGSFTSFSFTGIPKNAIRAIGVMEVQSTATSGMSLFIAADSSGSGSQDVSGYSIAGTGVTGNYAIDLLTPQTLYYQNAIASGTPTLDVWVTAYDI